MKKLTKLIILILLASLTIFTNVVYATSGNSSPLDELLPSRQDIIHGFGNEEYKNLTLNEDGFMNGRSVYYNRQLDNFIMMELNISVYQFSSTEAAYNFYNKTITELQSTQFYDEVEIPSAFAIITFEDADVGTSWLLSDNIVSNVVVTNDYTFEDTEEMLVYYTELQLNIIPEFQLPILLLIFVVATLSAMIIKKKLSAEN